MNQTFSPGGQQLFWTVVFKLKFKYCYKVLSLIWFKYSIDLINVKLKRAIKKKLRWTLEVFQTSLSMLGRIYYFKLLLRNNFFKLLFQSFEPKLLSQNLSWLIKILEAWTAYKYRALAQSMIILQDNLISSSWVVSKYFIRLMF